LRVGQATFSRTNQWRWREKRSGLAPELLVNGAIGLDATLDTAVAAFQGRFGLRTCEPVSVRPAPSTLETGAKLRLYAEVQTTGLFAEVNLDIPVNRGNCPGFT
jgi:hypothetical protein